MLIYFKSCFEFHMFMLQCQLDDSFIFLHLPLCHINTYKYKYTLPFLKIGYVHFGAFRKFMLHYWADGCLPWCPPRCPKGIQCQNKLAWAQKV